MKKKQAWLKCRTEVYVKYGFKVGMSDEDTKDLVKGLGIVSSQLDALKIKKKEEFESRDDFSKAAAEKLYILRDIVTLTDFVKRYYTKSIVSFRMKMNRRPDKSGNGTIPVFSDKEVDEINHGIEDIVNHLNNIVSSL
jgi:hypothetical protein